MPAARARRLVLALLLCGLAPAAPAEAAEVIIYRCTDAQGRLSLRDTPCAAGERQQATAMTRPVDPPPRPLPPVMPAAAPAPAAAARPRVVVVRTPRPMYECVRPDGERYTSDNGDGNPRLMPIVDVGYGLPVYPQTQPRNPLGDRVGAPAPRLGDPAARLPRQRAAYYPYGYDYGHGVYYGSQWVRDECRELPQEEICARLRDRRYQLDRRYHSSLQSEQHRIIEEQRVIDARMNNDCGAY